MSYWTQQKKNTKQIEKWYWKIYKEINCARKLALLLRFMTHTLFQIFTSQFLFLINKPGFEMKTNWLIYLWRKLTFRHFFIHWEMKKNHQINIYIYKRYKIAANERKMRKILFLFKKKFFNCFVYRSVGVCYIHFF